MGGGSLLLDLSEFGDTESQAIAEEGARKNQLGPAFTHIKNRRTLAQFREYLKADRVLKRALRPKRWSVEPY